MRPAAQSQQRRPTGTLASQPKSASTRSPATSPRPNSIGGAPSSAVNRDDLKPCKYCSRRFAPDRLGLHEDICARTLKKRRKTYDPVKHRVQGTDAENYVKKVQRVTKMTVSLLLSKISSKILWHVF